jgi:hypothetical protein
MCQFEEQKCTSHLAFDFLRGAQGKYFLETEFIPQCNDNQNLQNQDVGFELLVT